MFKLVRSVPLATSQVMARPMSSMSFFEKAIRQINKTFKGSETPYVKRDWVTEEMMKAEKWRMPKVFARQNFLRDRARANYVKHNERIRKLEDKVTGGAVGIKSFQNRF